MNLIDIVIGNACSLCAMITDSISSTRKTPKGVLWAQNLSQVFYFIGGIVLKGYSSAVQNAVSFLRNVLAIANVQSKWVQWLMVALGVGLGVYFNNLGLVGWPKCQPSIPWCCDLSGRVNGRIAPTWGVPYAPAMDYFDAANHAKRIKCQVLVPRAGIGDYICPPSGVAVAYNNIKAPKKIYWVQGSTHPYIPEEVKQVKSLWTGSDVFIIEHK